MNRGDDDENVALIIKQRPRNLLANTNWTIRRICFELDYDGKDDAVNRANANQQEPDEQPDLAFSLAQPLAGHVRFLDDRDDDQHVRKYNNNKVCAMPVGPLEANLQTWNPDEH